MSVLLVVVETFTCLARRGHSSCILNERHRGKHLARTWSPDHGWRFRTWWQRYAA